MATLGVRPCVDVFGRLISPHCDTLALSRCRRTVDSPFTQCVVRYQTWNPTFMMGWTPPNGPLRPPSTRTVFLHDGGLHIGATSPDSRLHVLPEIDFLRNKSKEVHTSSSSPCP